MQVLDLENGFTKEQRVASWTEWLYSSVVALASHVITKLDNREGRPLLDLHK